MRKFLLLIALLPLAAAAQITWQVEAGGSTLTPPAPYYTPAAITIHVGDIVHWHSVSGSHNVYGMHDAFPSNPEEFTSGQPVQSMDFTRTFTIPGVYGYHCTQMGHAATQHGTITVLLADHVEERTDLGKLMLYPVPAEGSLTVEVDQADLRRAEVMSIDGRVLVSVGLNGMQRNVIGVAELATGRYLLRLIDGQGRSVVRPFLKG